MHGDTGRGEPRWTILGKREPQIRTQGPIVRLTAIRHGRPDRHTVQPATSVEVGTRPGALIEDGGPSLSGADTIKDPKLDTHLLLIEMCRLSQMPDQSESESEFMYCIEDRRAAAAWQEHACAPERSVSTGRPEGHDGLLGCCGETMCLGPRYRPWKYLMCTLLSMGILRRGVRRSPSPRSASASGARR